MVKYAGISGDVAFLGGIAMRYKWYEMSLAQKIISAAGSVCFVFSLLALFFGVVNLLEYSKVRFLFQALFGVYWLSRAFLCKKKTHAIAGYIGAAIIFFSSFLFALK